MVVHAERSSCNSQQSTTVADPGEYRLKCFHLDPNSTQDLGSAADAIHVEWSRVHHQIALSAQHLRKLRNRVDRGLDIDLG